MSCSCSRRALISVSRFYRAKTRGIRCSGTLANRSLATGRLSAARTKCNLTWRCSNVASMAPCRSLATGNLPSHELVTLPALSPTMDQGTIVKWEKEEGDQLEDGDIIAQIETDKAVMDMETPATGYLAKIILPAGSRDIPLGQVLAVIVEEKDDIAAFKDFEAASSPAIETTPTSAPPPKDTTEEISPQSAVNIDYPSHELVTLPALSPTMDQGVIVKWEKEEGDQLEDGDIIAQIETDKAVMDMETPATGYLAKIILPAGSRDIPLGQVLAVIVEDQSLVPAFKDFQVSSGQPAQPSAPPTTPTQAPPPSPSPSPVTPPPSSATPTAPTPIGRIIASPFAKKVATDKGISLQNVQGSGPGGRIIASDVMSAMSNVAVGGVATTPASSLYEDISLSGMRKTIAARLLQSKQTIPHYYLTVDIEMDQLLKLRESVNGTSDEFKLSLNDFIIKACSLALIKIPEANSSWMDTFIRQYTNADISVAVSTEGGLITPIIFEANNKGLKTISSEMRSLAEKARSGRLQPHEYQGGTFTISNLGMYGISNFSAVINPPQSCILAIGGTDKRVIVGEDGSYKTASMMSVTMSCDHRVVDGAVGAQWLQVFKSYLENPYKMLL